jgi:hypothetical protein
VNGLKLARVVEIHPESHSVDIVIMGTSQRIAGVQALSGFSSSASGFTDMSEPDQTGYEAKNSGTRDTYAVVAWVDGVPVIMGYLYPQVSQMLFKDKGRMLYRHGSDVSTTIDKDGNLQIAHPSGAFVRIGEAPDFEDLAAKDYDEKWKLERNTDKQVHIRIEQAGGTAYVDIDPSGNVTVKGAESVTFDAPTTHCTGDLTVAGDVLADGDVKAGDISLNSHKHGGVQGGAAKTNGPE